MKIVKRALALGLSLAMLASAMTVGAAEGPSKTEGTIAATQVKEEQKAPVVYGEDPRKTLDFTVTDKNGVVLTKDKDYRVVLLDDGKDAGEHNAVIVGIGGFDGLVYKTYTVQRPPMDKREETKTMEVLATTMSTKASEINKVIVSVASENRGTRAYKVTGKAKKYLQVDDKTGKIKFKSPAAKKKFKKLVKKGKIKSISVKATVKGFNNLKSRSKKLKIKVTA